MPADCLAGGRFALSWGMVYLVHSTALLAGVWLFLRFHRRAGHGLRETLWKTALVGSIVTATLQMLPVPRGPFADVTVSLDGFGAPATRTSADPSDMARSAGSDRDAAFVPRRRADTGRNVVADGAEIAWVSADNPVAESPFTPDESVVAAGLQATSPLQAAVVSLSRPVSARGLLTMAVWVALAFVALGVARCLGQTWALRRRVAQCTIIECGPARRLLDDLRRLVPRAPEVRLLSAPEDPEPAAFGISRWTIVLPARAVRDLSEDELRTLLAHELAHLVRGDSLWLLISRVVCSCLAFQPLNHLARREWQRAAEFLCDTWAVSRTGTPLALARCLAEVAGWRLSGQPSMALLAATGRKSGLSDRIERLLETADRAESWGELRQRRRLLLAAGLFLGLVACIAPRLQLAVAGPESAQRSAPDPGRPAGDAQNGSSDEATLPANVEGGAIVDGVSRAPAGDAQAPAPVDGEGAQVSELRTLLSLLDRDLSALENELRDLEVLLFRDDAPPGLVKLAGHLRQEIARLKQRRNELRSRQTTYLSMPLSQ